MTQPNTAEWYLSVFHKHKQISQHRTVLKGKNGSFLRFFEKTPFLYLIYPQFADFGDDIPIKICIIIDKQWVYLGKRWLIHRYTFTVKAYQTKIFFKETFL